MWGAWGHAEVSILGGRLPSEMRFQRPKVPRGVCGNCSVPGYKSGSIMVTLAKELAWKVPVR